MSGIELDMEGNDIHSPEWECLFPCQVVSVGELS